MSDKRRRVQLALFKCQVDKVEQGVIGCKFRIIMPNGGYIEVDNSSFPLDVQVGDILTLYTEVYRPLPGGLQ